MQRRAFSYIELTAVVLIAGIVFVAAASTGGSTGQEQAKEFTRRFEADLTYAQSLSIANPGNPAILKVDGVAQKYWIARQDTPDTPVKHPRTREDYVVVVGPGGDAGLEDIQLVATNFGEEGILVLEPDGGTNLDSDAVLQIEADGVAMEVKRSETTGASTSNSGHQSDADPLPRSKAQSGGKAQVP